MIYDYTLEGVGPNTVLRIGAPQNLVAALQSCRYICIATEIRI